MSISTSTIPILLLKSPSSSSSSPSSSSFDPTATAATTSHPAFPRPASPNTSHPASPNTPRPITTHPTSSPPIPPDPASYTTIFSPPQYKTLYIPPLITTPVSHHLFTFLSSLPPSPSFTNLNPKLNSSSSSTISALVFTSQRAVHSFASLLSTSSAASATLPSPSPGFSTPPSLAHLRSLVIPLFAVGRATASAVQKTLIDGHGPGPDSEAEGGWMRGCWVEGSEAGTGEALARMILCSLKARARQRRRSQGRCEGTGKEGDQHRGSCRSVRMQTQTQTQTEMHNTSTANGEGNGDGNGNEDEDGDGDEDKKQKVIFLTGETRRDVVPRVLREGGVAVEEVVVYGTRVDDGFEAELKRGLRETEELVQTSGVRWIVLFSGQGAREMLRGLGWLDEESGRVKGEEERGRKDNSRIRSTFVASIGPTTAEYLKTEFRLQVDVCAKKPTGEALREGIERFMQEAVHHEIFTNMTAPVAERSHHII